MVAAFLRALGQLGDPRIVGLLGRALLLSLLVFGAVWGGVAWILTHEAITSIHWLDTVLDVLGGFATLLLTWLLFPVVVSAMVGLLLEAVAAAVEARHYPELPRAKGLGLLAGLAASLRFLLLALLLNLLLLPCLLAPVVFPFAYLAVNGYLLGRDYFEFAALRRLDAVTARALRRRHRFAVFTGGVITALLLAVPFVNLLAPVLATMAMVHAAERSRRALAVPGAGAAPAG